jgi:hypothetical protein
MVEMIPTPYDLDLQLLIVVLTVVGLLTILYFIKRKKLFGLDVWWNPKHLFTNSFIQKGADKQPFDWYSISHITHGILFYLFFTYLPFPEEIKENGFWIALVLEIIWEMFENSNFIINRYRKNARFKNYNGDSLVNILGDTLMSSLGYYFANQVGLYSLIFAVLMEFIFYPYKANFLYLSLGSLLFL